MPSDPRSNTPAGLDLDRLADYLAANLEPPPAAPLRAHLLTGGRSNLTYAVTDGSQHWVIRRPPLGHVLATAHDVGREYRVITALAATTVPVPRAELLCQNAEVIGAPFCVLELVPGTAYRSAGQLDRLGSRRTRSIALALLDQLAELHAIAPQSVGLGDFGRPAGFLNRQLRRWHGQLAASHSRDIAGIDELYRGLAAAVPPDQGPSIVHGDYKLDNLLFDERDRVRAVLDWEMSTIGDPLTDLALLLARNRHDTGLEDPSWAEGHPTTDDMIDRYAAVSTRDLSHLAWYIALAHYKRATILEGIHYRHLHQQTVGEGFEHLGDQVAPAVEAGLRALAAHQR